MNRFDNFYEAWWFLLEHEMFKDNFQKCLDIDVVMVNPETKSIDDNERLNTETRIWLECGEYNEKYLTHDLDLDCGGETFEIAIIKLANLVDKYYDIDGTRRDMNEH